MKVTKRAIPLMAPVLILSQHFLSAVATADTGGKNAQLMEELVVTAQKREQNLQDVAVSVSLLSGEAMAEAQLRNADELSTLIPTLNVQASSGPSTSSFNIRGIGTQAFSSAIEPSVSTMLDGVVMGNSGMSFVDLVDIERVEVLRGPQGTLYGKNASGGVIHIITRDPTPELSATVRATAVEDDEYRIAGTVSGPITDDLGYRLSGSVVDDAGFIKNYHDGETLNGEESYTVRGKLLWQPTERLELLWSSDYSKKDCECTALSLRSIMASDSQEAALQEQLPVVPSTKNQDVNNEYETFTKLRASGHSLTLNWGVGSYQLTSITAYRDWDNQGIVDLDNRPSNPLELSFPNEPEIQLDQFSQEIRLASSLRDWGSFVVGAFYFDQQADSGNTTTTALFSNLGVPPTTRVERTNVDNENISLFGEVNFSMGQDWQLTLGGRYTEDELSYHTLAIGTDNLIFGPDGEVDATVRNDNFSPKIALQWDAWESGMVYGSYVVGYKGPAFDTSIVADGRAVKPEESDAWELGFKSRWFDDRLVLNVAVFYANYDDFQAQTTVDEDPTDLLPGDFILVNAGEVSTKGVEIEFLSRPADNWSVSGGLAYIDGTIEDYPQGNCSDGQKFRGECPLGVRDLSGGQLPYTPKWKLTLRTDYTIALDERPMEVILGADLRSQDEVLYGLSQDIYNWQDAYTVVDARVTLAGTQDRYSLTAFVKNVFDQEYATLIYAQGSVLLANAYVQRVPKYANRTFGVELRYDF